MTTDSAVIGPTTGGEPTSATSTDAERPTREPTDDPAPGSSRQGPAAFNEWLAVSFKASRLTQRQLATKTGVHHSTISRLLRTRRRPTLETAQSLARGLGVAEPRDVGPEKRADRTAGVEYALRSDEVLTAAEVRNIMHVYLAARRASIRQAEVPGSGAPHGSAARPRPVPVVVKIRGRAR